MINENLHSLYEGKQAVNEDFFVAEAARRRRRILQTGFFLALAKNPGGVLPEYGITVKNQRKMGVSTICTKYVDIWEKWIISCTFFPHTELTRKPEK